MTLKNNNTGIYPLVSNIPLFYLAEKFVINFNVHIINFLAKSYIKGVHRGASSLYKIWSGGRSSLQLKVRSAECRQIYLSEVSKQLQWGKSNKSKKFKL